MQPWLTWENSFKNVQLWTVVFAFSVLLWVAVPNNSEANMRDWNWYHRFTFPFQCGTGSNTDSQGRSPELRAELLCVLHYLCSGLKLQYRNTDKERVNKIRKSHRQTVLGLIFGFLISICMDCPQPVVKGQSISLPDEHLSLWASNVQSMPKEQVSQS